MATLQEIFRVTQGEYRVAEQDIEEGLSGLEQDQYSTLHTIVLENDLKPDYLIMTQSAGSGVMRADRAAYKMVADPFGTGDLNKSGAPNVLIFRTAVARIPVSVAPVYINRVP